MFVIWQHLPNALNMYVCMYVYIYIYYTFSFWPQCYLFCNFCLFCGCVSLTRLTVSAGWRLLRFDKFMFWVKILSHIYPSFFICTVPFKFNLTSCIIFCMIILYGDLLYYIVFYILYYLYLGGFHASDSLSLNGSHPDMLFNLYFLSVICRINIFLLLLYLYVCIASIFLAVDQETRSAYLSALVSSLFSPIAKAWLPQLDHM